MFICSFCSLGSSLDFQCAHNCWAAWCIEGSVRNPTWSTPLEGWPQGCHLWSLPMFSVPKLKLMSFLSQDTFWKVKGRLTSPATQQLFVQWHFTCRRVLIRIWKQAKRVRMFVPNVSLSMFSRCAIAWNSTDASLHHTPLLRCWTSRHFLNMLALQSLWESPGSLQNMSFVSHFVHFLTVRQSKTGKLWDFFVHFVGQAVIRSRDV